MSNPFRNTSERRLSGSKNALAKSPGGESNKGARKKKTHTTECSRIRVDKLLPACIARKATFLLAKVLMSVAKFYLSVD